jgi:dimeric dUTPase (all-alpha-NTP-PPase superfamily)
MLELSNIYRETKYLDELFLSHYDIKSPEIIRKSKLELLVEFGELANETRCFKFWSTRQSGEKDKALEEYIDCLFMILYFCNINGVSLNDSFELPEKTDLVGAFLKLYEYGLSLVHDMNKDIVKKLLVQILYLSKLLNFDISDLEEGAKKKSLIIQKRLNSDY